MKTEIIITLSKNDLNALAKASEILKAIERARGSGIMPTTDDINAMGDINSYRDGKFTRRTMQNVFAPALQSILRFDENL